MLIKFLTFTIFLSTINLQAFAKEIDPIVEKLHDKKYLKLPDGKEIVLVRLYNEIGPSMHMRVFLRKKGVVLWDVTYNGEFDTLWADAHFHPLYKEEFSSDLNGDSYPEIAIAVWHGGHAMELSRAVIFTVKDDRLIPLKTRQNNYEFSRSVFKNKVQAESEFKIK